MSISPEDPQPFEDMEEEELEDDFESYHHFAIKWVADGAASIEEVAACLEGQAQWLRERAAEGWFLVEPVDGGHGMLDLTPEAEAAGVLRPSQQPPEAADEAAAKTSTAEALETPEPPAP